MENYWNPFSDLHGQKDQIMAIKERIHDDEMFTKIYFNGMDRLLKQVIDQELSAKEALLLIWMSTYAWETKAI